LLSINKSPLLFIIILYLIWTFYQSRSNMARMLVDFEVDSTGARDGHPLHAEHPELLVGIAFIDQARLPVHHRPHAELARAAGASRRRWPPGTWRSRTRPRRRAPDTGRPAASRPSGAGTRCSALAAGLSSSSRTGKVGERSLIPRGLYAPSQFKSISSLVSLWIHYEFIYWLYSFVLTKKVLNWLKFSK